MDYEVVGVIGAGVIGVGVAQSLAQTGHRVILVDISEPILEAAGREMRRGMRALAFFDKKAGDPKEVMARVQFTTDHVALREASFVVENATEKWAIKREDRGLHGALLPRS